MNRLRLSIVLTLAAPLSTFATTPPEARPDCQAALAAHQRSDMALDYEQFDQTEGSGFRALASLGCAVQAERLIVAYVGQHAQHASPLWWHAAQMAASAGDYPRASANARRSQAAAARPGDDPLMWDEYLQASIAFFDRDKTALRQHRDRIAATGLGFWGNRLNVNLLDTMLEEFDSGYDAIAADAMKKWEQPKADEKTR
jgi:hypothetical protein